MSEGEPGDFGALFHREADALRRFAERRLDDGAEAEDAVHDAFVKLMRRQDRPSEFDRPRAWMFTVLRTICEDRRRALARRRRVFSATPPEENAPVADPAQPVDAALADRQALRRVDAAMALLPPEDAEALTLVAADGFAYAEVARILNVPVGTVRSRLHRARRRLRACLEPDVEAAAAEAPRAAGGTVTPFRRRRS